MREKKKRQIDRKIRILLLFWNTNQTLASYVLHSVILAFRFQVFTTRSKGVGKACYYWQHSNEISSFQVGTQDRKTNTSNYGDYWSKLTKIALYFRQTMQCFYPLCHHRKTEHKGRNGTHLNFNSFCSIHALIVLIFFCENNKLQSTSP